MKVMTYEEFWEFVETKKKFPDTPYFPKTLSLNEGQRRVRYQEYLTRMRKMRERAYTPAEVDEEMERVNALVRARDGNKCRLIPLLSPEEKAELYHNARFLVTTIDAAHIHSRGRRPDLKHDVNNIVLLNRFSHSMLDTFRNPINGDVLFNKDEWRYWWKRIEPSLDL